MINNFSYHFLTKEVIKILDLNLSRYLVDPAKEAHFGHRLSHASVSSGNETANSVGYHG